MRKMFRPSDSLGGRCILSLPLLSIVANVLRAAPAAQELQIGTVFADSTSLVDHYGKTENVGSSAFTASAAERWTVGDRGLYFSAGFQAENFRFSNGPLPLRRLQDYAGVFSFEYYQESENVASLTVRPGWFFGRHASASSWDIPVDLFSAIPLGRSVNGVIGFSNARFYHHALPVFGLVWTFNPRARLEAIFPEPALVFTIGQSSSLRIGGELTGIGFLTEIDGQKTVVEYVSYRLGAEFSRVLQPGAKIALGAGVELERSFDFFRRNLRERGSGAGFLRASVVLSR